ncbi:MAG: hypothetical protein ACXIUL_04370 [Wenzhouxiangella sp.]
MTAQTVQPSAWQPLRTLLSLMRRELWESPVSMKWLPLGIGLLTILMTLLTLAMAARVDNHLASTQDVLRWLAETDHEQLKLIVTGFLFSTSTIFFQFMLLLIIFYLAGSLFDDRKDRSILFWKSLPVSDGMVVASKLATACLLIPLIFLVAIILTHLVLLLIASGLALSAGVNPITTIWLPASLPYLWSVMAAGLLVQALWLLPIYAWLLFCSSWAPRLPILIAIGIPAVIAIVQHSWSLLSAFSLPSINLGLIMLRRLGSSMLPMSANLQLENGLENIQFDEDLFMRFSSLNHYLLGLDLWIGVVLALPLLFAAVWFRRRATDQA